MSGCDAGGKVPFAPFIHQREVKAQHDRPGFYALQKRGVGLELRRIAALFFVQERCTVAAFMIAILEIDNPKAAIFIAKNAVNGAAMSLSCTLPPTGYSERRFGMGGLATTGRARFLGYWSKPE